MIYLRSHYSYRTDAVPVPMKRMPGGEMHPEIDPDSLGADRYTLVADTRNADDLFAILMTTNAIRRGSDFAPRISLVIGYVPYARQDRVSNKGEALSIEGMADFINMMGFDRVTIHDPHSDVTSALINNCFVVDQADIIHDALNVEPRYANDEPNRIVLADYVLVAPDAGAIKKTNKLAQRLGCKGVVYADKVRDTKTGKITHTAITRATIGDVEDVGAIADQKLLVVDDICDGGYTFTELAKVLNEYHPESVELFITHGLFTKGTQVLLDAGYKRVFTTNCYGLEDWNSQEMAFEDPVESNVIKFRTIRML